MADLTNLDDLTGSDLTEEQLRGIIAQIDLNIVNLMRDGKLGAARVAENYAGGQSVDRAAALDAMMRARAIYQKQLDDFVVIEITQYDDPYDSTRIP